MLQEENVLMQQDIEQNKSRPVSSATFGVRSDADNISIIAQTDDVHKTGQKKTKKSKKWQDTTMKSANEIMGEQEFENKSELKLEVGINHSDARSQSN